MVCSFCKVLSAFLTMELMSALDSNIYHNTPRKEQIMQHYDALTNSELNELITERIHNARDRELLHRRLIDGMTYDELSAEFFLSRRQVARIIAKANSILTTEHPPDRRHRKGTPASLRGCFFYAIMIVERRCRRCTNTTILSTIRL